MSDTPNTFRHPRQLTRREVIDIHVLVMQSRPQLKYVPKKKNEA